MRDEGDEEREFLERLQARTGRDLAQWMAAITLEGFADKNQVIDWLRRQGFTFQRASWLERIHANGGKPIYGAAPAKSPAAAQEKPPVAPLARQPEPVPVAAAPSPAPPQAAPAAPPADAAAALEKLISAAKGYRPLYHMLETAIRGALPALVLTPRAGYISLGAPAEFAAITLHASEIRLGLDLGDRAFDSLLQKSKMKGPGPAITHMAVLTDARQVNGELLNLLEGAHARVNKQL
jgi:hypothetical protein